MFERHQFIFAYVLWLPSGFPLLGFKRKRWLSPIFEDMSQVSLLHCINNIWAPLDGVIGPLLSAKGKTQLIHCHCLTSRWTSSHWSKLNHGTLHVLVGFFLFVRVPLWVPMFDPHPFQWKTTKFRLVLARPLSQSQTRASEGS